MRVLLTKDLQAQDLAYIKARVAPEVTIIRPAGFSPSQLVAAVGEADIVLGAYFSEELLRAATRVRFFQIPWNGIDTVDLDLLRRHGATVCNSHSNAQVVAEHAVALMLDVAKKIAFHDRGMRRGDWNRLSDAVTPALSPFSKRIAGSHVAFIGFGEIARQIQRCLSGFACRFSAFTRTGRIPADLVDAVQAATIAQFHQRAVDVDFLFIAAPLTGDTRGLVDTTLLQVLPPDAILINVSRGPIVEPGDLFRALTTGRLAGAGIDTWYDYPSAAEPMMPPCRAFPFHTLDNVVLSPHRAGYVTDGFPHLDDAIENLNRAVRGDPPLHIISYEHAY